MRISKHNKYNIALTKSSKHIGQCCLYSKLTLQRCFHIACSGCIGCHENRRSLTDTSLRILTLKIFILQINVFNLSKIGFIYQNTFLEAIINSFLQTCSVTFVRMTTLVLSTLLLRDIHRRRISCTVAAKVILFLPFVTISVFSGCVEKDYKNIQCTMVQDGKVQNQRLACRHQCPLLQRFFLLAQLGYLLEPDKISVYITVFLLYIYTL